MLKYLLYFLMIGVIFSLNNCNSPSGPDEEEQAESNVTIAKGPGGPSFLNGYIKDLISYTDSVTNVDLYVMNSNDYKDTLLHVYINSESGGFKITDLPEITVDLIFTKEDYLNTKIGELSLQNTGNSFYSPLDFGTLVDSTLYMHSISDTLGSSEAGNSGYGPEIGVMFKSDISDSLSSELVEASDCVNIFSNKVKKDSFKKSTGYFLRCPEIESVPENLSYFNWLQSVEYSGPVYGF